MRPSRTCRDAKNNKILEVAVNGSAQLIVAGDRDLLSLNPFRGIPIVTPSKYIHPVKLASYAASFAKMAV
jgi:uncharacterized protein